MKFDQKKKYPNKPKKQNSTNNKICALHEEIGILNLFFFNSLRLVSTNYILNIFLKTASLHWGLLGRGTEIPRVLRKELKLSSNSSSNIASLTAGMIPEWFRLKIKGTRNTSAWKGDFYLSVLFLLPEEGIKIFPRTQLWFREREENLSASPDQA